MKKSEIRFSEYKSKTVKIPEKDAYILKSRFSKKIKIKPSWKKEHYEMNPRQYVGVVSFPETVIWLDPKVNISNLFFMLCYAHKLVNFKDDTVDFSDIREVYEHIIKIFNKKVSELIRKGVYKNYKNIRENLNHAKGKILSLENMKKNFVLRNRLYCGYDIYTPDVVENQIIKRTLYVLSRSSYRSSTLKSELMKNYYSLTEVSNNKISSKNFPTVRYNRLNRRYKQIHELCKLFLDNVSISDKSGYVSFYSFIFDMNKLFEKFILEFMKETIIGKKIKIIGQSNKYYLDEDGKMNLRPDILIQIGDNVLVVLDTKYKIIDQEEFKSFDLYQLLGYCEGIRLKKAILLYPKWEGVRRDIMKINNTQIKIMTIDLSGDIDTFKRNCHNLINEIIDFANDT